MEQQVKVVESVIVADAVAKGKIIHADELRLDTLRALDEIINRTRGRAADIRVTLESTILAQ